MGMSSIILAAFAGSALMSRSPGLELIAGIFALSVSIIVSISTYLNPGKSSQEHLNAGTSYQDLKNDVQIFYEVESLMKGKNNIQLVSELSELSEKRDELDKTSPRISKKRFDEGAERCQEEIIRTGIIPPPSHARV